MLFRTGGGGEGREGDGATWRAPAPVAATDPATALASLADLRDRGAITTEEYEAKKADLLSRL